MQITITLSSAEELAAFLENMAPNKKTEQEPVKADQEQVIAEQEPAAEPAAASVAASMPEPVSGPAEAPAVTRQAVQAKAIALMDEKKQDALQALLKKYGVPALPLIPDNQLAAFMADLEAI